MMNETSTATAVLYIHQKNGKNALYRTPYADFQWTTALDRVVSIYHQFG